MKLHVTTTPHHSARPAIIIMLTAIFTLFITSCTRRVMTDEEASRWIAAFSPAHIDMDSKIRVEFNDSVRSKIVFPLAHSACFDISPSESGKVFVSSEKNQIEFTPIKSLTPGQKYECRVIMSRLMKNDSLGDFRFEVMVDKRELCLKDLSLTVDENDVSLMNLTGLIEYSTAAGDSVTAGHGFIECNRPEATVTIDSEASGLTRRFWITGIKRKSATSHITVSTNPMSGFSHVEERLEIPAINNFMLLTAKRIEAVEPYIDLVFSSPLSQHQDLDGLITIDRVSNLKIERDGCNVKVYYPNNAIADLTLRLSSMIKNHEGRCLDSEIEQHFEQELIPPAVKMPFKGTILPDNNNLRLPFRAVNLAAVDVEVVKIFPRNVMSFILENNLHGTQKLRRYGRLIYHKTVRLDKDPTLDLHRWQNFSIDLKGLFQRERGAIYNIRLSFCKAYSLYDRVEPEKFDPISGITDEDLQEWDEPSSYIYRASRDDDDEDWNWTERNDPTKASYYMMADMPEHNVVASTLGLIVKKGGNNDYHTIVTDIISAAPRAGIKVTAWNFQFSEIASSTTDANGFATLKPQGRPYIITATDGQSTTYLKVTNNMLSMSNFNVSGKKMVNNIKGFTYGDRAVWRPGDDIHLTLILDNSHTNLPKNHPVVLELYNPSDQLYSRHTMTNGVDGFYVFHVPTNMDIPTGSWKAVFKVGNQVFNHPVMIETIKPNRLKININTPDVIMANKPLPIALKANWLTGATAHDMDASLEMALYKDPTPFAAFKKYTFSNPLVNFNTSSELLLSGKLDHTGTMTKKCTIGTDINTPGMLRANFTAKVIEAGGDASITGRTAQVSPFGVYVGIDLTNNEYTTDKPIQLPVVVVNQKGAKMKTRQLSYKIYRLDWYWWWEGNAENLSRYVNSTKAELVASGEVTAANGRTSIPFQVNYPDCGRYLVLVRDIKGGHATGGKFSVDWPEWRGQSDRSEASGSTELTFTFDKPGYQVGETAQIYLPKCEGGQVLLSIENSSAVINRYWVNTRGDRETCFKLPVDGSMTPNFYVAATLLRPHSSTSEGNVPLRQFGVSGVKVIDPNTLLHPIIEMPEELHPQQTFTVKVSEQDNKPMTYTLAIVDEGLLDITNFKTPQPWTAMNQWQPLGVSTWDMYDDVVGAYNAKFKQILSIGGDEALRKLAGKEKRFNPVVKFIGPFTLKGGSHGSHTVTLPNYIGSVRVMVVAAHKGCYGSADNTVKVSAPLMLLTTLPRVLACGDAVDVPVNIFATDKGTKQVQVSIETLGAVAVTGAKSKTLTLDATGEQLATFKIKCHDTSHGKARIVIKATSGNHNMQDTTYIDVQNPMPQLLEVSHKTLNEGENIELSWDRQATQSTRLQIASMPTLNFGSSMAFFENYSHQCTEQLSSKALFMLYGRDFLSATEKADCETVLPNILRLISERQLPDGGFGYWPGHTEPNLWATSMAGIALAEARRQGFRVNNDVLDNWTRFQEKTARDYRFKETTTLDQAFRLYSLSRAGHALKSAMNRLRESNKLPQTAAYCLASAYAIDGRYDVATKITERAERTPYTPWSGMFQSELRDKAIATEAYSLCKNTTKATLIAQTIATHCEGSEYVTQDIAFASIAIRQLGTTARNSTKSATVTEPQQKPVIINNINTINNITCHPSSGKVSVINTGKTPLLLSLTTTSTRSTSEKFKPESNGLHLDITYTDTNSNPLEVTQLKQGTEFCVHITVTNRSHDIESMALTYAIPSGWEMWNDRFTGRGDTNAGHCDIRDDRINYYQSLNAGCKITFDIRLRAAYNGTFMLPPTVCEDMYDPSCRAITTNTTVSVIPNNLYSNQ